MAAGMLAPVTEVHYGEEDLLRLNIASSELYPSFVAELEEASGLGCGYEPSGTLIVARDADDNAELDHIFDFQRRLGLKVDRLTGRDCRTLEPGLAAAVRGGILAPDDHRVDPHALTRALVRVCERAGVEFVPDRVVELRDGEVVTATGPTLDAGSIVLAAGAHSGEVTVPPEVVVPIRPVKGQLVTLRGDDPPAQHNIRGIDGYIVARSDGRVVIGATMEERGFDHTVTGEAVFELLRAGYELLPGLLDREFVGATVGLRPATPDNAPLVGPTEIASLFLATGHFRNGVLLAPITAAGIAQMLAGEVVEEMAPFAPARFTKEVA
jgi:glycine oxidase